MKISFFGATETVTGSKYLIEGEKSQVLVDCGLFQGLKELRLRNWQKPPFNPARINSVILTHAHIDHTGYLPLLVKHGFRGKIYCTPATLDLCKILLPDCGHIQEEDANYANRKGFSKHHPALPLYTADDAREALNYFETVEYEKFFYPAEGLDCRFTQSGHIPGAAFVTLSDKTARLVFSGDLGRPNDSVMMPPRWIKQTDYLVLESTYGGREHPVTDILDQFEAVINRTAKRGGTVIIPAFSVGRSQTILYALYQLKRSNRIADIPVYLNSPMSISATDIFARYQSQHRLSKTECEGACGVAQYIRSAEESKKLHSQKGPMIIISASGMATGGRVLYHLENLASDKKHTIVMTGFQAAGTRGARIVAGEKSIKIHGQLVPINAEVVEINNLSAHADQAEILGWLSHFQQAPKKVFITHGEPFEANMLKAAIESQLSWRCEIPKYMQKVDLA